MKAFVIKHSLPLRSNLEQDTLARGAGDMPSALGDHSGWRERSALDGSGVPQWCGRVT